MDNWLTEEKIIAEHEAEQRILRKIKRGEDSIENVMAHDIARVAALMGEFDKEKKE